MKYVWSKHAKDRLRERSHLHKDEVELRLDEHRYVVKRSRQPHHLIWDHVRRCLIGVPVNIYSAINIGQIPSILAVNNGGSNYTVWQRAEAEHAWLGEKYFRDPGITAEQPCAAEIVLTKVWVSPSGWRRLQELQTLLTWPISDQAMAQSGDVGVLALFRDRVFRHAVKHCIRTIVDEDPTLEHGHAIHLKKPGAYRIVPFKFFLAAL